MKTPKSAAAVSLMIIVFASLTLPVFAADYNPGVSAGQYVRYGNFVGTGPGVESFNDYDWLKVEATSVSGKEVTLLSTGQLKNGAATPGNGTIQAWNVETGTEDGTPSVQGPVIAGNLNEDDAIPPPNTYSVNKTETRTYLGVSRSVNILDSTISTPDYTTTLTYVYNKASGMLLEAASETAQTQPEPSTSKYSYSVTETNIFGSAGIPMEYLLFAAAAIVIIIIVMTIVALRKRAK